MVDGLQIGRRNPPRLLLQQSLLVRKKCLHFFGKKGQTAHLSVIIENFPEGLFPLHAEKFPLHRLLSRDPAQIRC